MNSAPTRDSNGTGDVASGGPGFYQRYGAAILCALLLASPPCLWMAGRVLTPGDMSAYILDVSHWLPKNSLWLNDLERFSEVAGQERSNVIRISWPGCTESDPRVTLFADNLKRATWNGTDSTTAAQQIFESVITIDSVVGKLRSGNSSLTDDQIQRQLQNVLIGPSGTTCVIATLATRIPDQRKFAIEQIYAAATRTKGLARDDVRLFGGPVYTRQVDESGLKLATIFTPLSAVVSLICAWLCLRNLAVVVAIFLNAIACSCAAIVSLHISGAVMDPLLMMLPGFWFVMAISSGIHFVNYYVEIVRSHRGTSVENSQSIDLSWEAVKIGFRPDLLATFTTCIGLAALCSTDVLPVWRFGFHATVGMVCAFIVQYLFLPSWLHFNSKRIAVALHSEAGTADGFWVRYGEFASGLGIRTVIAFLVILAVSIIGFTRLGFSNKLSDQYSSTSRVNTDAAWFEEQIGPLLPFEVLVRFAKNDLPRPSDRLGHVAALQSRIEATGIPCKTLSATAIVPWRAGSGARQSVFRSVLDSRLRRHRTALADTGFVVDEHDAELWRVTVFAYNSIDVTMNEYFSAIQSAVESHQQQAESEPGGVVAKMSYAGLGSRMAVITQKLGGGLMQSCLTSAILISLVVIIALRSLSLGLSAMLPNVAPVVIALGAYGYFQPRLDIGSIMTASIAIGIAVDDTIHFMYWYRQGIATNLPRVAAVKLAINRCGHAIVSTSLINGLGFVVFSWGDFMPAVRFGQLMFGMLAVALAGDLLILPALLLAMPGRKHSRQVPSQGVPEQ